MEYNPITVTELNKYIKNKFDKDNFFENVLIEGEISNYKRHYTVHHLEISNDDKSFLFFDRVPTRPDIFPVLYKRSQY